MKLIQYLLPWVFAVIPPVSLAQPSTAGVSFPVEFLSGDTVLSGTLVRPSRVIAAVVLVHGSGQETRNIPFAEALARQGIATLTYDKRGVGDSGGTYAGPEVGTDNTDPGNLNLLADDAAAAVAQLVRISAPNTPIGLMGGSQAGWIIPLAAARTPDVRFMIIWSGPLVTTLEQLSFQSFTNGKPDFWKQHTEAEVRKHIRSDRHHYRFEATDPVDSLRKLSIPGFWLYGDRDVSVPVGLSVERLKALIAAGKPLQYRVVGDSGHQLPRDTIIAESTDWVKRTIVNAHR